MGKVCCSARLHQKRRYCFLRRCYAADPRTFRSDDHSGSGEEEDEMRQPPLFFFFLQCARKFYPFRYTQLRPFRGKLYALLAPLVPSSIFNRLFFLSFSWSYFQIEGSNPHRAIVNSFSFPPGAAESAHIYKYTAE